MIDTSMYGRIGGFDQGLRMGQAIGGVFTTARNTGLREQALERIKAGEDYNAVVHEVMQQSPEIAQELINLRAANMKAQSDQLGMQQTEQQIQIGNENLSRAKLQQSAMPMLGALMVDNADARKKLLKEAAQPFKESNPAVFDTIIDIGNQPEEVQANAISGIIKTLRQAGVYPQDPSQLMGQGTALSQNLSLYDQAVAAGDIDRAELIKRNIDPYSRSFSGGIGAGEARKITEHGLTPILAEREQATTLASERGKQEADAEANAKKNSRAFGTYQAAIGQLEKAASQTTTNPVAGLMPAVTASAQIMEGSISMMAPVLKEMFRQAGEGTFTDKDQELLLRMVPSRSEHPEAIKAKLEMIDNLVRAKLQQGSPAIQPTSTQPRNFENQYMGGGQ